MGAARRNASQFDVAVATVPTTTIGAAHLVVTIGLADATASVADVLGALAGATLTAAAVGTTLDVCACRFARAFSRQTDILGSRAAPAASSATVAATHLAVTEGNTDAQVVHALLLESGAGSATAAAPIFAAIKAVASWRAVSAGGIGTAEGATGLHLTLIATAIKPTDIISTAVAGSLWLALAEARLAELSPFARATQSPAAIVAAVLAVTRRLAETEVIDASNLRSSAFAAAPATAVIATLLALAISATRATLSGEANRVIAAQRTGRQ